MVLLKSVQAAVLFDLSMSEMEWAGSSGRFDQGPKSIPTSHFQLKIAKFRIYVDLSWVISGKRDMELFLELERLLWRGNIISTVVFLDLVISSNRILNQTSLNFHAEPFSNRVSFLFYCPSACSAFCLPRLVTSLSIICVLSEPVAFCSKQIPIKQLLLFWICLGLPDLGTLGIVVH